MILAEHTKELLKNTDIRMLALDLDGTVLTNDKRLTGRTEQAIRDAIRKGIMVVIVTGRPKGGLPVSVMSIPGIRYVISSNGAVTEDLLEGKILRNADLDRNAASQIVRLPMDRGLIHSVFIDGIGYCEPHYFEKQWNRFKDTPLASYVKKSRRPTDDIEALIREADAGVENIWIMADSREERDLLDLTINDRWEVQTVLTAGTDVEVGDRAADKGVALRHLSEMVKIPKTQIVAIGDNENDLGMLKEAAFAVAMGNANDNVKRKAAIITDTNEHDGAAAVIEQLLR